ncbi:CHAT domain-containing protein [Mycena latifolia]|nr:CHAT domain-containing protein [Mycena latifolia]
MEDTAISSPVGTSDYGSVASDTQGIVALTSPSNEAENGQSGVNPAKLMRQEQGEGENKDSENDTVDGAGMMNGIQSPDRDRIGYAHVQRIETSAEDEATEYFNMAYDLLLKCKAACNISSLNTAISLLECAAFSWPPGDTEFSDCLNHLATALLIRFIYTVDANDVQKAVELRRGALGYPVQDFLQSTVQKRHEDVTSKDMMTSAVVMLKEVLQAHDQAILENAILLYQEGLKLTPETHSQQWNILLELADALLIQFHLTGNLAQVDNTVSYLRQVQQAKPNRSICLIAALTTGHEGLMGLSHQAEGTGLQLEVLQNNLKALELMQLGEDLFGLFKMHHDLINLEAVVRTWREAELVLSLGHESRGRLLNNLAAAVQARFKQQGDPKDLDEAITLHREALEIHAAPHPDRGSSLNNLASAVQTQFEQQGDPKDLDEAITLHREALEIHAAPHPDQDMSLNNLAGAVQTRFEQQGDPKDLDEAITLHREALEIHAAPHPCWGSSLNNLANAVQTRFEQQGDLKDIDEAITLHREASTYMYSSPLIRFSASHQWIRSATRHGHQSSVDAYRTAINLLPQLAAFSLDLRSRQQMLARKEIASLASASATCAIGLNQNNVAVELLEASRSIFWAQALHLRTPIDKLEHIEPMLASKLRHLSQQLEQASFRDISQKVLMDTQRQLMSMEAVAIRCRQLNEEWDKTVNAVRKVPGFEDFLRPKTIASLCQAAASGPIIILLASDLACSALIVKSSEDVQHVQLPALKVQTVKHYADLPRALSDRNFNVNDFLEAHGHEEPSTQRSDLEAWLYGAQEGYVKMSPNDIFRRLLADIWQTIVKPVFEVLDLKKSEDPSRLWWCPTGPFSFVPIHAAGIYDTDGTDCVSDYVISSYTPTLTALLNHPAHITASFKMTAVIEPHAPKCSALPGTKVELEKIKSRVPSQWLTPLHSTTRDTVMHHLHSSSVVHFACHGTQDLENPLNSGLILSDGCLDMSRIMCTPVNGDTMKDSIKLAFLSACETAKGDAQTPDEAMHLAATLLFAGFSGVVATMWRMNDDDGPKIADTFYEYLFQDCSPDSVSPILPDLSKAAKALHLAVIKLYRDPSMTFQRWVPFVHYGL